MIIKNTDGHTVSAFVYNSDDYLQVTALASKALVSSEAWNYNAPSNNHGRYTVLIKRDSGGGSIRAAAIGASIGYTFTWNGWNLHVTY